MLKINAYCFMIWMSALFHGIVVYFLQTVKVVPSYHADYSGVF